ncbi:hypothetical protein MNO14_07635 [Luteimonas sp. S4-F44]|uniref:hypothetical protein n=1 Tax=Luteimonas sp. S4-F44 TaxID=2925842 RepID=UPI001F539CBC|nr:hypothetical protein [Luteimonas sp. S4-F44]UNK43910.1 hypothetical protein MNO14_07635 [Luteimonas sp. S4-F44]
MKTVHTLSLAIALAIAPALVQAQSTDPAPLTIGGEVRGEITSRSSLNHQDGSRSQLYRVDLREGEVATFKVTGALRARLAAFLDNELIGSSTDRGEAASLTIRARRAGRYTIAVSGTDASSYGPYTLISSRVDTYNGQALRVGATIGDWTDGERELPLQIDRDGIYTIDMMSDDFDSVLALDGPGVSVSNDDGGEGSNARLTLRLAPGRYRLTAKRYGSDGASGAYRISVTASSFDTGDLREGGDLAIGSTVTGLYAGRPHSYRFTLPERQVVRLDMRSDEIDPLMRLSGQGVQKEDDDGGERLNARIGMLLEAGTYTLQADSATPGAGPYTLSLTATAVPEGAGGGALTIGRPVETALLPGMTDRWSFEVRSAGDYAIEMRSSQIDSYLSLTKDGNEVASDDDGAGGLDARIVQRLQPGRYVVEASAIDGDAGGPYRILLERR